MLTRLARARPGGGGGAEAAAVALGFVQEPVGVVLRRDAAGPEAAAATLRQACTARHAFRDLSEIRPAHSARNTT